ncbi:unnamed protein product [Phaeothamnion confervicola]
MANLPSRATRELRAGVGPVFVARLTDDGKYCLTAGQDRTIRLWNPHRDDAEGKTGRGGLALGALIKSYMGPHGYEIRDVAIAPGNGVFASCGGDKTVFLWDVLKNAVTRRLVGHEQRVNCCAFAAGGTVLLTGGYDRTVRCWDMRSRASGPIQVIEQCRDSVTSVAAGPSGDNIICSSVDGSVRTFDLRAGCCFEDQLHAPVTSVAVSHDGECVLAACLGGVARLLSRMTGADLNSYTGHEHRSYPVQACFSGDDAHVISGSEDGSVCIWDLVEATMVARLQRHTGPAGAVSCHPTDRFLVSGSYDGSAVVWT